MIHRFRPAAVRTVAACLLACLWSGPAAAQAAAPAAKQAAASAPAPASAPGLFPPGRVADTFFGTRVEDPYRALENTKDPQVAAWMKAQSEYAHAALRRVPGRAGLLAAVRKYDEAASARVVEPVRLQGGLWFYQKRGAAENQFKLYMRRGENGEEVLLVDPEVLQKSTGKPHAINYFTPSPDGRYVAYGISAGGSEAAVLHVLDTTTRKLLGTPVDRADFATVAWAHDGLSFVFNRLQPLKRGAPVTQKYQDSRVYRMVPGRPPSGAVFGRGVGGAQLRPEEIPVVQFTHDGRWAIGTVYNGVQSELALYVAPAATLDKGRPRWTRLVDYADAVTQADYFDGHLYLVSHKGASRSQVLRVRVDGRMADAQVWVPPSNKVVIAVGAAADALYVEVRDGNVKRLLKLGHRVQPGTPAGEVKLPVEGAFSLTGGAESTWRATDPHVPGALLDLGGWTRARQIYEVAADGGVRNTGLQPKGPFDAPDDITATEVQVKSHDGALVPMSIIHKRGLKTDGSHPAILYGYASYGSTEEPFYSTSRMAWLEAGGVFAVANPRGSGVYGQDWYKAGFQASKPNTWRDFIACAEWLIANGYSNARRLGIWGGSAGGILVGRAMTERPDLFAAVVSAVGALDGLRFEDTANGTPNIPEFGSKKTEAGFRSLMAMSTYQNIKPGTAYPAVMFTHGVNDPRVEVWQSTKTAARLMAATTSGRPVLLLLDYESGHGIGNTKQQVHEERANVFSFFMWQFGMPGFEPL
jgi:prolyl oligopeptidase